MYDRRKCSLPTFVLWFDGNSSVALQFPYRIPYSSDFPGSNYRLQRQPGRQFNFIQCFVKHWVLYEFSYLRAVKYTHLEFLHAYLRTSLGGKQTHYLLYPLGCPRGVMVKAMNCGIVVREFVLQSRYYVHFRANTLGKGMNPRILPPAMGK